MKSKLSELPTLFKKGQKAWNEGIPFSKESIKKMSEVKIGKKDSDETKQKKSESLKKAYANGTRVNAMLGKDPWNKGRTDLPSPANKIIWTQEQIEAIKIDSRSSYKIAEELGVLPSNIQKLRKSLNITVSKGNTGNKHSQETIEKISKTKTGKCIGKDNPFFGKQHTEESNKKNKLAHQKINDEQREVIKLDARSNSIIAKEYGVSKKAIYNIKKRG